MATSTQLIPATRTASPLAYWHLLSLDAPTVAAVWTWFLGRACHLRLPVSSVAAMALAVWMLYAADRLLDARQLDAVRLSPARFNELEERHLFHHRHRAVFLAAIALAAVALAALLPYLDPAAIRLYLIEGSLLFAWFLILHATHNAHRLPKEIAVGLFFAAATFIPTVARAPEMRLRLLPVALLFAALCSLNCLYIYRWEHEHRGGLPAHATTRLALDHRRALTLFAAVAGAALAAFASFAHGFFASCPIASCSVASILLLLLLDRSRSRLTRVTLRAAADLALLTPLLLLPFMR